MSLLGSFTIRTETMKGFAYLYEQGCNFEFRTYRGKYTHNKIFIVDNGRSFAMGTFNMHTRGFDVGNDCEIGVLFDAGRTIDSSSDNECGEEKKDIDTGDDYSSSINSRGNRIMSIASEYVTSVMDETEIMSPQLYTKYIKKSRKST